jgi:Transposase
MSISRSTVLRVLMALPIPLSAPTVLSVDDVALRRGRRYATVLIDPRLIDAATHQRVDVLTDRKAATLATWLREHPGAEIVCRDGSAAYAEAIRQGAPEAVQVSDRWHLWHGLGAAMEKSVIAHGTCWRTQPPYAPEPSGPVRAIDERTRARHAAVHELLGQGVGLLDCARRLGWALPIIKEHGQALRPSRDRRTAAAGHPATAARWSTPTAATCAAGSLPNPASR